MPSKANSKRHGYVEELIPAEFWKTVPPKDSLLICKTGGLNAEQYARLIEMPSKSPAQARLMAAAAHTKGGYGGVPQSVGKEFNQADAGTGVLKKKPRKARKSAMKTYLVK